MCISLIQEQVARQSAKMIGSTETVIELDTVEILPRQKDFFCKEEPKTDAAPVSFVAPVPDITSIHEDRPETTGALPGETIGNADEEDEEDQQVEEEAEDEGEQEEDQWGE